MVDHDRLFALVSANKLGTLATIKSDGRPQLSNINYAFDPNRSLVRISVTDSRAKTANVRRDPRACLHVSSRDGWTWTVLEGDVTLSDVATDPHDSAVEELIDLYRAVSGGEHPDWDDYRRAMVADRRLVLRLAVTHAYGSAR